MSTVAELLRARRARTRVRPAFADLHRIDLIGAIKRLRAIRARDLTIQCERAAAVQYRDVLDLYLALSGVETWRFRDGTGEERAGARARAAASVARLARDLATWPLAVARVGRELDVLEATAQARRTPRTATSCLFLRTDHVFDLVSGGSVGHLAGVLGALSMLGVATRVLTSTRLPGVAHSTPQDVLVPEYDELRNVPEWPQIAYSNQVARAASASVDAAPPDFIYQRYSFGNYAGLALKARYGIPFICEYNGSDVWVLANWNGRRVLHPKLLDRIERINLACADVVVVVSSALRDEIVERGADPARVLVNPNGVDPEQFRPDLDGGTIRARIGAGEAVVVGFIGTFGPWHGVEVLAQSFGELLRRSPSLRGRVKLLLIGDGPRRGAALRELERAGAADEATFTGQIPQADAPAYLAACDVLVASHVANPDGSAFFGSPTKLFEYMAMGRAIVASRLGQMDEILRDGQTARLVPPGEVGILADALAELATDPALRGRLGAAARARAVARHSWRTHTERILAALLETPRATDHARSTLGETR